MARLMVDPRAVAVLAENRIQAAMEEGQFRDLAGEGQPIPGIDQPYDPDWWLRAWFARQPQTEAAGKGSSIGKGSS